MIILGVDPGFQATGFGIMKRELGKTFLLDYGLLRMSSSQSISDRIKIFHDFFECKIETNKIDSLALETPFLGKNAQNFLKLGYLRGILYLLSSKYSLSISEFSPTQVKLSLTGFGAAQKDQVARVVLKLFPGMNMPEKLDVTDALAVTLCGLWASRPQPKPLC